MIVSSKITKYMNKARCITDARRLQQDTGKLASKLFDITQIEYCGEGNNTIVVSHRSLGVILRLRKSGNEKGSPRKPINRLSRSGLDIRILEPLGCGFTRNMWFIRVSRGFLKEVEQKIASFRPVFRSYKGVDYSVTHVIVGMDARKLPPTISTYSYGPTITVELKPKFGVIPMWPATGPVMSAKTSAALFCLHQHHSSKLSRWRTASTYCPCDLFSGDRRRMLHSLHALLCVPQINMRIHLGSQVILSHEVDKLGLGLSAFFHCNALGDDSSCKQTNRNPPLHLLQKQHQPPSGQDTTVASDLRDRLGSLLVNALLLDLGDGYLPRSISVEPTLRRGSKPTLPARFSTSCALHPSHLSVASSPTSGVDAMKHSSEKSAHYGSIVPLNSVLGRVLAAQLVSYLDIVFVWPHYKRVCHYLATLGKTWESYTRGTATGHNQCQMSTELRESFDAVKGYLSSLVARDCSIMITFQRATAECPDTLPTVITGEDEALIFNPEVIDIDPKPLDKIEDRLAREHSIVLQALASRPDLLQSVSVVPAGTTTQST